MAIGDTCPQAVEGGLYGQIAAPGTVYLYSGGALHSVADPPTFEALGFDWGKVNRISDLCLALMGFGAPFPSVNGGIGPVAQAVEAFRAGAVNYGAAPSPIAAYPVPAPAATAPAVPATHSIVDAVTSELHTLEADAAAHKTAIALGVGGVLAWRFGVFRALLGRHRR